MALVPVALVIGAVAAVRELWFLLFSMAMLLVVAAEGLRGK